MTKEKLIVDREIMFFAFRYALGRMTYAPYSVIKSIKDNIINISTEDIKQYIKEIYECENYGMSFDKTEWINFAKYLENELKKRENQNRVL